MKDDYLWDKTGEPDPAVEHMERVLGQLGHRRTASKPPAFEVKPGITARPISKLLAIAAALAFAALALGAFLVFQRPSEQRDAPVVMATTVPSQSFIEPRAVPATEGEETKGQNDSLVKNSAAYTNPKPAAQASRRREVNRSREPGINERVQAQGLMAKEQLIKALQITSSKLDVVQKKVQGPVS
jgi:hypothetical protein